MWVITIPMRRPSVRLSVRPSVRSNESYIVGCFDCTVHTCGVNLNCGLHPTMSRQFSVQMHVWGAFCLSVNAPRNVLSEPHNSRTFHLYGWTWISMEKTKQVLPSCGQNRSSTILAGSLLKYQCRCTSLIKKTSQPPIKYMGTSKFVHILWAAEFKLIVGLKAELPLA